METYVEKLEIMQLVEKLENIKKISPAKFNKLRGVMIAMAESANKVIESKYNKNLDTVHRNPELTTRFLSEFTKEEISEALNIDLNTTDQNLSNVKFSKEELNIICSKYPTSLDVFMANIYECK